MGLYEYYKENKTLPINIDINSVELDELNKIIYDFDDFFENIDINLARKILLKIPDEIDIVDDNILNKVFNDYNFVQEFLKNIDNILHIKNCNINSKPLVNILKQYFYKDEFIPGKRIRNIENFFSFNIKEIKKDYQICEIMFNKKHFNYQYCLNDEFKNNPRNLYIFLLENPYKFSNYLEKIDDIMDEKLFSAIISYDIKNIEKLNSNNEYVVKLNERLKYLKNFNPNITLETFKNATNILLSDEFMNLDTNFIKSVLKYNTNAINIVSDIIEKKELNNLMYFIEIYTNIYEKNLENIQFAIQKYNVFSNLVEDMIKQNNPIDSKLLENIINNDNKLNINSVVELENINQIIDNEINTLISESSNTTVFLNKYIKYIFNMTYEEFKIFLQEYFTNNINELQEYCKNNEIEYKLDNFSKFIKDIMYISTCESLDSIDKEKLYKNFISPISVKQQIEKIYSQIFNKKLTKINDSGVKIIDFEGQDFNILIHRIYNFNYNLNNITKELINDPSIWLSSNGASTISTSLITDKKISGVFSSLKTSNKSNLISLDSDQEIDEYKNKKLQEDFNYDNNAILKDIDETSVFYGFTELDNEAITKMSPTDMMVKHGKNLLNVDTSVCKMMLPEDLAYWTKSSYWNEVALRRENPKTGEKILPNCIVCFDNIINENSKKAAAYFKIPIININRQKYQERNNNRVNSIVYGIQDNINLQEIDELFYLLPYPNLANFIRMLLSYIDGIDIENKCDIYEHIKKKIVYFIEHSFNNAYMDTNTEEINKIMLEHLKKIDCTIKNMNNKHL